MSRRPIGIFDSGVGGLTVFKAMDRVLPGESFVYLGDTARVPYGTRSPETVIRYTLEAVRFLGRHDVKMVVVACNTASSVALEAVAGEVEVPVVGVIAPGARRAAAESAGGKVGVIGTRATVASGAYQRAIHSLRPEARVISTACPLFVPLAEEGWTDNEVARMTAESYLAPLRQEEVDTLVLGCTHYPLLKPVIGRVMGAGVRLVDSAEAVAGEVAEKLAGLEPEPGKEGPEDHFYVTDAPEPFLAVAERFLGGPVRRLERASL